MSNVVRPATRDDSRSIASIAAEVWPEESLNVDMVAALIGEGGRSTLVAELDDRVVGFVDGFATRAADECARWEIDLLAVSPSAQGHGVGRRLIQASVAAATESGASLSRGLVRVGNLASERVFAACGFMPDPQVCELWTGEGLLATVPSGMHIVPVRTFRYAGHWLERVTAERLRALRANGTNDLVGALLPVTDAAALRAAASVGLEPAGRYRFWRRSISV